MRFIGQYWLRRVKYESNSFAEFDYATAYCQKGVGKGARMAVVLKEGEGINAGKFFLHHIVR